MRRLLQAGLGVLASALGVAGAVYGWRVSRAQGLYFESKFGAWRQDPARIAGAAARAHALYPYNFELSAWAAETAYRARHDGEPADASNRLAVATHWCEVGLGQNPYLTQLRLMEARLAEAESPLRAARLWAEYVDWHYWNPYNHAVLAQLYARAGLYAEALRETRVLAGQPYEREARQWIADAWREEIAGIGARRAAR